MMLEDSDDEYCLQQPEAMEQSTGKKMRRKRKSVKSYKRRFSEEQIRSLEMMFEAETKLEPRKKVEVAGELGLQPRQVAIWFQNKRARWKSKQLENEYGLLRANYNALASSFQDLKTQKQALITQLQKLNDLVQKSREKRKGFGQDAEAGDGIGDQLDEGEDVKGEFEATPSLLLERGGGGGGGGGIHVFSDDDSSIRRADYFGLDEEPELIMSMVEPADSSENWGSLDSREGGLLDESDGSYQWWDFWT